MSKFGEPIQYIQSERIEFPDFDFTYDGMVDPESEREDKTTASLRYRFFEARKDGHSLILKVVHGQLPPPNQDFEFLGKKYRLYTFSGPDGKRLQERHLIIEELS